MFSDKPGYVSERAAVATYHVVLKRNVIRKVNKGDQYHHFTVTAGSCDWGEDEVRVGYLALYKGKP